MQDSQLTPIPSSRVPAEPLSGKRLLYEWEAEPAGEFSVGVCAWAHPQRPQTPPSPHELPPPQLGQQPARSVGIEAPPMSISQPLLEEEELLEDDDELVEDDELVDDSESEESLLELLERSLLELLDNASLPLLSDPLTELALLSDPLCDQLDSLDSLELLESLSLNSESLDTAMVTPSLNGQNARTRLEREKCQQYPADQLLGGNDEWQFTKREVQIAKEFFLSDTLFKKNARAWRISAKR